MSAVPDYAADRYLDWDEVVAHLEALVASAPAWARLDVAGQSREGRDIPILTIGAQDGGADERPGFWLDAGTHCAEWTGVMAALHTATRWIAGLRDGDGPTRAWFEGHTAYVLPCMSPDGYVAMRAGAPFLRSTLRPPRDGRPRVGLHPSDLDGDGRVRWMRWRHPAGTWVFDDPANVAKMRPRTLDDDPSTAYFVADEGVFLDWDGVRWLEASREFGQDLNRNFPSSWTPFEMFGMDSGDYPLSEPESRATVEAFRARPRIGAALSNHTYTGCILTHPYREPSVLGDQDLFMLRALAKGAVAGTGYRVFKVMPEFTYDPKKPIVGVWADALATTFGVAGYTLELWDPYAFAGKAVEEPAKLFVEPDMEILHAVLDAFRDEPGAILDWKPFDHPQLGAVEIGGIEYMTTVRNPPERLLAEECDRGFMVADRLRRSLPTVRAEARTEALGGGLTRVELMVENLGFLPTSSLQRAETIGMAPPLHARASGLELVEGVAHQALGWLDGWGAIQASSAHHPIYVGLPADRGHRARAVWVVRGEGALAIQWDAGRGGRGSLSVAVG
ncbi:MAG: hypothetical protein H6719_07575 [Sandaracinaceae bacterium]|nr:hypothetical protein [Sandaracinaceae bacterium]